MPLYLVNGANTMNLESTTNSASASGPEFESQSYKVRVRDVSLIPNGQTSVRGFSLATLAAALAACGGGSSGGPAAPPPPAPPPANNAPTASPDAGAATEDGGAVTGGTGAADSDGDPLTYSVTGDATYGSLTVADDGTWTYEVDNANDAVQGLAEGVELSDTATITVSDGEDSVEATVTITITGVNDAPTGDDGTGAVTAGMDVAAEGSVNPADVDDGDSHTFTVETAPMYGTLEVAADGAWTYSVDHDNEAVVALAEGDTMEDTATIMIDDGNGGTTAVNVTITVTGANDNPTGEDGTGAVMSGVDTPAEGNVNAMDVDTDDTQTFAPGTAAAYGTLTVDELTGAWSYMLDQDAEAVRALDDDETMEDSGTIVITDAYGGTAEVTVTVTITGVNDAPDAPTVIEDTFTVAENDTSGVNLAQLEGSDPEDHDYTFSVDNADFEIDVVGNAALLKIKDGVGLDFEGSGGTITLMVTATDDAGLVSDPTAVTITVTDVNEAPGIYVMDDTTPDGMPAVSTRDENTTGPVGAIMLSDPEDTLGEADITVSDPRFGVKTDDEGGIWLMLNEAVNHEMESEVMVTVTVTDSGSPGTEPIATSTVVTITIADVNEAPGVYVMDGTTPDGVDVVSNIYENSTGPVGQIHVSDEDEELGAANITLSDTRFDTEVDSEGGIWLMLNEAVDHEMETEVVVTVTVTDSGGLATETNYTVTIDNVNEPPTIEVVDDETPDGMPAESVIEENTTGPVGAIILGDPEVTLTEENITVSDPRFGVKTDDLGGIWLVLNEPGDHDTEPEITLTVTVTDPGGLAASAEVTIMVADINEVPTIDVVNAVTPDGQPAVNARDENSGGPVGQIILTDQEETLTADNLVVSDPRFSVETDEYGGIWLKLNDGVNFEEVGDTINLTVTVTDTGDVPKSATAEVSVRINDVNEMPTIAVMDSETTDGMPAASVIDENDTGFVGLVTVTDQEGDIGVDNIVVSDDRFGLMVDDFGGIWLELNKGIDADTEAEVTVTLTVTDAGGLVAETDVVITVTDINEAPTIDLVDNTVAPTEDGPVVSSSTKEENSMGPVAYIVVDDEEDTLTEDNITIDDDRFIVKTDTEGGLWVVLNEEQSYEDFADGMNTIDIVVTVTDSGDLATTANYTVTITDVNDAPHATGEGVSVIVPEMGETPATTEDLTLLEATSGEAVVTMTLDLDGTFDDEDGDVNFRYTLSEDTPSWVQLINVVYVTNEDGTISATGDLVTEPPGHDPVGAFMVTIIATDDGGAAGTASFEIIVDDGNDVPTAIDLTNPDGTDNAFFDLEVDEHEQGTVLGTLTVEDQDSEHHSHGQHTWEVDNDSFEIVPMDGANPVLKLKDDAMIDFEMTPSIELEVTATDGGGASESQIIQVQVNDMNDPVVVANQPGNWWVTIDDDLDPEDVAEGAYLDFSLETEAAGDSLPLFTDQDAADASIPDPSDSTMSLMIGKLTYAFVSGAPDWLEIDADTGRIYSKAGEEDDELPTRGVHTITVSATDGAGSSEQATFKLAVVVSDGDNDDNDQTQIESASGMDIDENPEAGTVVATFTITDEDFDLSGLHPWGDVTVTHTAQNTTDSGSPVDVAAGWFELEMVSESGDTQNWQVKLTAAGATAMNYEEGVEDLRLTISAGDAVTDAADRDTRTINFDVDDVNEAPDYTQDATTSTNLGAATPTTAVGQQEVDPDPGPEAMDDGNGVITLYLNLSGMYEDPDEDHDDDDITFTVSTDTPWISVATQPVEWETYMEGPDEDANTDDDGAWGPTNPTNDDDIVAVVTIDRTMMHSQDADGSFTITATDSDGAVTTTMVPVTITDENVDPAADAEGVEFAPGDDTPYQNDDLRMRFVKSVDPDFTGTEANADNPILVVYEWKRDDDNTPDNGDETLLSVSAGEPSTYTVTQEDVGMVVQGTVTYFELFDGMIVQTENMAALDARSEIVKDRPDDATGTITFGSTNDQNELVATVMVEDADGIDAVTLTYVWESSVNGRGGWTPFADDEPEVGTAQEQTTMIGAAQQGMHVRLVVEFNDENGTPERVVSETIQVGAIDTITAPTIMGFGTEGDDAVAVGRTLEVDVTDAEVQWMAGGMVVGTGTSFTVTSAQAGMMITAVITSKDGDNVTSLVTTAPVTIAGGGAEANTSPIVVDQDVVLLGTAPAMAGALMEYETNINASELFEDVEGGLMFSFAGQGLGTDQYEDETLDVYLGDNGTQLLIIDETTGDVRYVTTKATGHGDGGATTDGGGNTVDIIVTAMDGANTVTNTVSLAIDVPGTYTGSGITDTVVENMATTADANVGTINIIDLNSPSNEYGQYDWATDNDAYTVTANETDSSIATVARMAGKMLDGNDTNPSTDGEVTVTIMATPKSGGDAIEITLTVTVTNDPTDDPETPPPPNEVPGLKDNEGPGSDDDMDDETEDSDEDDDDDAGTPPEMDAMAAMASMLDDGLF